MTCPDQVGSINTETPSEPTDVYVPPNLCVGTFDISTATGQCADEENLTQQSYIEETLSISGAPINIYRLLGIHEQGTGSLLTAGSLVTSQSNPGFPASNINSGTGTWQSFDIGGAVVTEGSFIGLDFGIKLLSSGDPEYVAPKPNWKPVAAILLKQANLINNYARQVRVEITDGTTIASDTSFTGTGDGLLTVDAVGAFAEQATIMATAISTTEFMVMALPLASNTPINLGIAIINQPFVTTFIELTITAGSTPYALGDLFTLSLEYVWKRAGVFNLVQTANAAVLNLQSELLAKAIRVKPTLFTGAGNWEVLEFDVLDSAPTNINNIQDLFFNENRDRDYAKTALTLKCQYSPTDSINDLSRFGLNILDQYSFTTSYSAMVRLLGRPIVTGDILELPMELQYDQNLRPIRKFLEVTDTGWAADGFSPAWKPMVYRFSAQQALPSQETRDIFGTIDTQKYMVGDSILADGIGEQIDTTPLTITEEIRKAADDKVPEVGSDEQLSTFISEPIPQYKFNVKSSAPEPANPTFKANIFAEDGLPKNGEPYGEGYKLPDSTSAVDGEFFRLNYPEENQIAPRLYRFSAVKNRWIYLETDRRGIYSSHKPSVRKILESNDRQGLKKKQT